MAEEGKVRWHFTEFDERLAGQFSEQLGVSRLLGALLVQRGFQDTTEAERFIHPKLTDLADPFLLAHMEEAVTLVERHLLAGSEIAIIGDYDVDGITSTAFLAKILTKFGVKPHYFIPLRFSEGYGLSQEVVQRVLKQSRPALVIALDCGTNSVDEIRYLRERGIEVLVIDHHTLTTKQLPDAVLLNPHVSGGQVSLCAMCAVGLVFKFVHAFLKRRREKRDPRVENTRLRHYFDLVALGTIADMVPIRWENRVLVKYGLQLLAKIRRPGLEALCMVSGIPDGIIVTRQDVSFKLAPRINVSGRLSDAALPVELFLAERFDEALKIAKRVDLMNRERQQIEHAITEEARAQVEREYKEDPGIVLFKESWHSGVVGIVAGKLAREYNRPVIVLALERGVAKGSGRSIGHDLVKVMEECEGSVDTWGGHKMAVGVSLRPEKLETFREKFNQAIRKYQLEAPEEGETYEVAATLKAGEIGEVLIEELDRNLQPYGQGNEEPIFCLEGVYLSRNVEVFGVGKKHIRFWIERKGGSWLTGIGWNFADRIPERNRRVDLLVTVSFDEWNNERFLLLTLADWRYSN